MSSDLLVEASEHITKSEYDEIWEEIFARHKALGRMFGDKHARNYLATVIDQGKCDCVQTVLALHGIQFDTGKFSVCSRNKKTRRKLRKVLTQNDKFGAIT